MNSLPLHGIRVVDISRVFAMPYCGAYLADLGAEVIKIDTHYSEFVDTTRTLNGPYPNNQPLDNYWETGGTFQTLNRGKRSLTLDLRSDYGLNILKQLIQISDIFLENFTPRVMRRFGLDYPTLKTRKPDLIMVSNTGYGHSGPWSDFGAMATALEPTHGTGAFMGYLNYDDNGNSSSGTVPNKIANSYTDFLASWTAQLAIMASLYNRYRTGHGAWVDLAMYQVGASFMGEGVLDYAFNGRRTRRIGNRHEYFSPHGCYKCSGRDSWVVLAVRDDYEWKTFCEVLGDQRLIKNDDFKDAVIRYQHQDELDLIISDWTSVRTSVDVMALLQGQGIPCASTINAKEMLADPQFVDRGYFETLDHSTETHMEGKRYTSRGWRLSGNDIKMKTPAPELGEGNTYVLRELLALPDSAILQLQNDETIGNTLKGAATPSVISLDRQVDLGWIVDRD
jgi:crotonobetainyl-CoA:carnitine CoA-transferase CaiB-like acyl-CoA transferase